MRLARGRKADDEIGLVVADDQVTHVVIVRSLRNRELDAEPGDRSSEQATAELDARTCGSGQGASVDAIDLEALEGASRVLTEDDTHFDAIVVSAGFEGRRALQRHQQVYATLGERMGREIHALSIQAYTPAEWQSAAGAPR